MSSIMKSKSFLGDGFVCFYGAKSNNFVFCKAIHHPSGQSLFNEFSRAEQISNCWSYLASEGMLVLMFPRLPSNLDTLLSFDSFFSCFSGQRQLHITNKEEGKMCLFIYLCLSLIPLLSPQVLLLVGCFVKPICQHYNPWSITKNYFGSKIFFSSLISKLTFLCSFAATMHPGQT